MFLLVGFVFTCLLQSIMAEEGVCDMYKLYLSDFSNCAVDDDRRLSINATFPMPTNCMTKPKGCVVISKAFGEDPSLVSGDVEVREHSLMANGKKIFEKFSDDICNEMAKQTNPDDKDIEMILVAMQMKNMTCPQPAATKCIPLDLEYSVAEFRNKFPIVYGKKYSFRTRLYDDDEMISCYTFDFKISKA